MSSHATWEPDDWDGTLCDYLASSNEDICVTDSFRNLVLPELRSCSSLHWSEIGPGPGTKTVRMAAHLAQGNSRVSECSLIEPSTSWRASLNNANVAKHIRDELKTTVRVIADPLHRCSAVDLLGADDTLSLVTCIHVLYDEYSFNSLQRLVEDAVAHRRRVIFFLVMEAPTSAFRLIRSRLAENGYRVPTGTAQKIDSIFQCSLGRRLQKEVTTQKVCKISADKDFWWFIPFLLGTSPAKFLQESVEIRDRARAIVEEFLGRYGEQELLIPDEITLATV
jgi:hypothetical protein